jgi:hypothetical protein
LVKDKIPGGRKISVPLIHQNAQVTFDEFWKDKPVAAGRTYNFAELANKGIDLTQYTHPLGWTNFFNIKETHYPSLVSAFYFNVVVYQEEEMIIYNLDNKVQKSTTVDSPPSSAHRFFYLIRVILLFCFVLLTCL